MKTHIYKCRGCKEIVGINEIITLYISGREVKKCPFCGRIGKLKPIRTMKSERKM